MEFAEQLPGFGEGERRPFLPGAQYYPAMDCLLYLEEDLSYRADRVDQFLTLLWHPYEWRIVGLKLKGFRALFAGVKELVELDEHHFLTLIYVVTFVLMQGGAREIMESHESARKKKLHEKYRKAIAFAARAEFPFQISEMDLAA